MKKIGLFWGSSSDNTKIASEFIVEYLEMNDIEIESHDVADIGTDKILEYDNITSLGSLIRKQFLIFFIHSLSIFGKRWCVICFW